MSRSARQFFEYARFEPALPRQSEKEYKRAIRTVVGLRPGKERPDVVIAGYTNLNHFSRDHARLLQENCGGAWQSYFQRGNWRMTLPFSRKGQAKTAKRLKAEVRKNCPPILHVARFPQLSINHTVLVYECLEAQSGLILLAYDPNEPNTPIAIHYDQQLRWFIFPQTKYFAGGKVNAYPIYTGLFF
ncbi:MAG TPA: hypothetical protein VEH27_18355 [Methylomirabilota bacterium]|nr:hypothetical protein [Methylomirabilota bacterium]